MIWLLQCYLWHSVENILICRVLFESFHLFSDKKNENSSRFGDDNDDGFFVFHQLFGNLHFISSLVFVLRQSIGFPVSLL